MFKKISHFLFIIFLIWNFKSQAQCSQFEIINQRKIAIVFGETKYQYANPLTNPVHDADDIRDSLTKIGFEVLTYKDDNLSEMSSHIDDWFKKIVNYDVALFYYSGHGAEVEGQNYLFPIDANPQTISDLPNSAINATTLLARLDDIKNKYNIMILDACRSNPFTRSFTKGLSKGGLAFMSGSGTFIGFAASPGKVAQDGNPSHANSRNGIYTEGILKYITKPNLPIDQIFTKVNMYVRNETSEKQIPFKTSSFSTDYCFSVTIQKGARQEIKYENIVMKANDIVIDSRKNYVFTINQKQNNIILRDLKSLAFLKSVSSPNLHPKKILLFNENTILVTDSLNRTLVAINYNKGQVSTQIPFDGNPVAMIINNHSQTLYVACNDKNTGSISIIDLRNLKVKRTIPTQSVINDLIDSVDGKIVYANVSNAQHSNDLIEINALTGKLTNTKIEGDVISVSPNGHVFAFDPKSSSIKVYGSPKASIMHAIPNVYSCQEINFSHDGRQAYLSSGRELLYVTITDFKITHALKLTSQIGGIVEDNAGGLFVSLPAESRVLEYDSQNPQTDSFKELKINTSNEFAVLVRSAVNSQKNITRLNQINKNEHLSSKVDSILNRLQGEIPGHWVHSFGIPGRYSNQGFGVSNNMHSKELDINLEWNRKTRLFQDTIIIVCRSIIGNTMKEDIFKITDENLDTFKSSMKDRWMEMLTQEIKSRY